MIHNYRVGRQTDYSNFNLQQLNLKQNNKYVTNEKVFEYPLVEVFKFFDEGIQLKRK